MAAQPIRHAFLVAAHDFSNTSNWHGSVDHGTSPFEWARDVSDRDVTWLYYDSTTPSRVLKRWKFRTDDRGKYETGELKPISEEFRDGLVESCKPGEPTCHFLEGKLKHKLYPAVDQTGRFLAVRQSASSKGLPG
jgi:hypothetical protein